jgi:1-deoxy-D-xylulose-5-phosphate reductoisomerase
VLNAADEEAVLAFREGRIGFQDIARINRSVLDRRPRLSGSVEALLEADRRGRELARGEIARRAGLETSST